MHLRTTIASIAVVALATFCGWSYAQHNADQEEARIRKTAVSYYTSMIFADIEAFKVNTRSPLAVIRDGTTTLRTEAQSQAVLHDLKVQRAVKPITDDDRKLIQSRIQALFDEADIQFIGANTATITFLMHPADPSKKEGESLCMLVLYRKDDRWLVTSEVTDSAPLPPTLSGDPSGIPGTAKPAAPAK